jgi:hypothetical protein
VQRRANSRPNDARDRCGDSFTFLACLRDHAVQLPPPVRPPLARNRPEVSKIETSTPVRPGTAPQVSKIETSTPVRPGTTVQIFADHLILYGVGQAR